jgi:uncharacterized membrane protein
LEEEYAECLASNAKKFDEVGRTLGILMAVGLAGFVEGFKVEDFFTAAACFTVLALFVVFVVVFAVVFVVVFLGLMEVAE